MLLESGNGLDRAWLSKTAALLDEGVVEGENRRAEENERRAGVLRSGTQAASLFDARRRYWLPFGVSLSPPPPDLAWVEPRLAVGSKPYEDQFPLVAALGVRTVVAVVELSERELTAWQQLGVSVHVFPTPDWAWIRPSRFDEVVDAVLTGLHDNAAVLLHCLAGLNRAPTFAAALLCHRYGYRLEEALDRVRRARPGASPTPEQIAAVRDWLTWRRSRATSHEF